MNSSASLSQMDVAESIERDAATALGYMLFEYSRLEMELGLLLAWSDDGKNLDAITKRLEGENFHGRLDLLDRLVRSSYQQVPEVLGLYSAWLSDAHAIRAIRNQFIHGRWGFIPASREVANVIGLPTSGDQEEVRYSIFDLNERLSALRTLRSRLGVLRDTYPV